LENKVQVLAEKTPLKVSHQDKDKAKSVGAEWDGEKRTWYATRGTEASKIKEWIPDDFFLKTELGDPSEKRLAHDTFLVVLNNEVDAVRKIGAKWDKEKKLWFAEEGTVSSSVMNYLPETKTAVITKYKYDKSEKNANRNNDVLIGGSIYDALQEGGADISGADLVFSKDKDRIPALGKNHRNVGVSFEWLRLDIGLDRLKLRSFLSGEVSLWATADRMSFHKLQIGNSETVKEENRKIFRALLDDGTSDVKLPSHLSDMQTKISSALKEQRKILETIKEKELKKTHFITSLEVEKRWIKAVPASLENDYVKKKGLNPTGWKEDWRKNLLIPFQDMKGKIWGTQRIYKDDNNNFQKRYGIYPTKKQSEQGIEYKTRKDGTFHIIGGLTLSDLASHKMISFSEGAGTGNSFYEATKIPNVAVGDTGNMLSVVKQFREKFPKTFFLIAGDNDILNSRKPKGINNGLEVAQSTRDEVRGVMIALPSFSEEDIQKGNKDWNDVFTLYGAEEVVKQADKGVDESKRWLRERAKKEEVEVKKTEASMEKQEEKPSTPAQPKVKEEKVVQEPVVAQRPQHQQEPKITALQPQPKPLEQTPTIEASQPSWKPIESQERVNVPRDIPTIKEHKQVEDRGNPISLTKDFLYSKNHAEGKEEKLYQIVADETFSIPNGTMYGKTIPEGTKGGWTASLDNLNGNWIESNVKVLSTISLPKDTNLDGFIEIGSPLDLKIAEKLTEYKNKSNSKSNGHTRGEHPKV